MIFIYNKSAFEMCKGVKMFVFLDFLKIFMCPRFNCSLSSNIFYKKFKI